MTFVFSLLQLNSVAIDMWVAGQETTASTLSWIIAILVAHPEIQERIHKELDEQIQEDREVRMSDRSQLVYLNAFILVSFLSKFWLLTADFQEAGRFANVIVQNVLRLMTKDVEIQGHTLRKGTFVCPQISAMLRDPKVRNIASFLNNYFLFSTSLSRINSALNALLEPTDASQTRKLWLHSVWESEHAPAKTWLEWSCSCSPQTC
jgi:hypothetical protein